MDAALRPLLFLAMIVLLEPGCQVPTPAEPEHIGSALVSPAAASRPSNRPATPDTVGEALGLRSPPVSPADKTPLTQVRHSPELPETPSNPSWAVQMAHAEDQPAGPELPAVANPPAEPLPLPKVEVEGPMLAGGPPPSAGPVLTLEAVIHMTLEANPDLQSALERTQIAESALARARADFFPTLTLNANYQASNNPFRKFEYLLSQDQQNPNVLFQPPSMVDNFHPQVHFQQMLYSGGLGQARQCQAEADRDASQFGLAAVQNQLMYQVAEAYYRLFQASELVHVRAEAVAQMQNQLKDVQSQVASEQATKAELFQVEARLADVRETQVTAQHNLELGWNLLENLTGVRLAGYCLPPVLTPAPWSDRVDAVEATVSRLVDGHGVEGIVAEAMADRPEVGQGESQRRAAEQRVKAAQAAKRPTAGFVADYDYYLGSTGANADSVFLGLAFSLNLFDGGRAKADICSAQAQVREIAAKNRRMQLDIELDMRRAYLRLREARQHLELTAPTLRSAEEVLRQTESRHTSQRASLTELLQARLELSAAHVRYKNALTDVEIARAGLQRAVGRLTSFLAPLSAGPAPDGTPHRIPQNGEAVPK